MNMKVIIAVIGALVIAALLLSRSGEEGGTETSGSEMSSQTDHSSVASGSDNAEDEMVSRPGPAAEPLPATAPAHSQAASPDPEVTIDRSADLPVVREPASEVVDRGEFSPQGWAWIDEDLQPMQSVTPVYPRRLREEGVEGDVVAAFTVMPDGTTSGCEVTEATTLDGDATDAFDGPVCRAVSQLQYQEISESRPIRFKFHFRLAE